MLSMTVCNQCWNKYTVVKDPSFYVGGISTHIPCPEKLNGGEWIDVMYPPPPHCPYKLEHAVAEGMHE